MKRLLKNGTVVNVFTGELIKTNVLFENGIILGVDDYGDDEADEVIDAAGKYIAKIASKRSSKPILIIGTQYKAAVLLKKLLPLSLINRLVGTIYAK